MTADNRQSEPHSVWDHLRYFVLSLRNRLTWNSPKPRPSPAITGRPGPAPSSPPPAMFINEPPAVNGSRETLFMIFIDGLHAEVFDRLLASGSLPHLQQLLTDRPAWQNHALSSYPTSTTPVIPELLTGVYSHRFISVPDKIHAFDRNHKAIFRYEFKKDRWDSVHLNLFDHVALAGGEIFSYFEGFFESASVNMHDEYYYLLSAIADYGQLKIPLDYDLRLIQSFMDSIRKNRRAPNLAFLRMSNVDIQGHFFGPESKEYREAIVTLDRSLGELFEFMKGARLPDGKSLYDHAHFLIFSDHGMMPTHQFIDLDARLAELGFKPLRTAAAATIIATSIDNNWVDAFDVISVPGGSNVTQLYLRARSNDRLLSWRKRSAYRDWRNCPVAQGRQLDLVKEMLALQGVDLILAEEREGVYHVFSPDRGHARVFRRFNGDGGWELAYVPDSAGSDPFDYCSDPKARDLCCAGLSPEKPVPRECYHGLEQWLEATYHTAYPTGPFFTVKAFSGVSAERADLIVNSKPGYGFMARMKGDHGGMNQPCLRVNVVFAGPRVDPNARACQLRLIDLYPAIMTLFGLEREFEALPPDGKNPPLWKEGEKSKGAAARP